MSFFRNSFSLHSPLFLRLWQLWDFCHYIMSGHWPVATILLSLNIGDTLHCSFLSWWQTFVRDKLKSYLILWTAYLQYFKSVCIISFSIPGWHCIFQSFPLQVNWVQFSSTHNSKSQACHTKYKWDIFNRFVAKLFNVFCDI